MIRAAVIGSIGSGKTFVAKLFKCPVFNADNEVKIIYQTNKACFQKLNKILPSYIKSFPIKKTELLEAISKDKKNLKKISYVVHPLVRQKMNLFLKKNKSKKIVILDIPLLLENNLDKKNDILVFVKSKKKEILKRLKKRKNFNMKIFNNFKKIQLSLVLKKKKSQFIIKNNFKNNSVKVRVKEIIKNLV